MNAQMTFFAKRVDPSIGGSYMTLLNTAANLGGTWPTPVIMGLLGLLSSKTCDSATSPCSIWQDPYIGLQIGLSLLGCMWIVLLSPRLNQLSRLPEKAWRTGGVVSEEQERLLASVNVELT